MGKLSFGRVLNCFCLSFGSSCSCFCINTLETQDGIERSPLIGREGTQLVKLTNVVNQNKQTLALQLKPKMVVLRVSMHCNGCARKVEKHISKMEGVSSFQVDLESKKVVVVGDITPFEVLQSISKVKIAELWTSQH